MGFAEAPITHLAVILSLYSCKKLSLVLDSVCVHLYKRFHGVNDKLRLYSEKKMFHVHVILYVLQNHKHINFQQHIRNPPLS